MEPPACRCHKWTTAVRAYSTAHEIDGEAQPDSGVLLGPIMGAAPKDVPQGLRNMPRLGRERLDVSLGLVLEKDMADACVSFCWGGMTVSREATPNPRMDSLESG